MAKAPDTPPLQLLGLQVPAAAVDSGGLIEMARCFAEEFTRMGWTDGEILAMFQNPIYQGPYLVWQRCGKEMVHNLLEQVRKG